MSIFCRHNYLFLQHKILNHYNGDGAPFDGISYEIKIICKKCGKIKILETKKIQVEPYYEIGQRILNDAQKLQFDIYENIIIQKVKKYGIIID